MKSNYKILFFIVFMQQYATTARADCNDSKAAISTDFLLNLDIKELMAVDVSTASKKVEAATEAPAIISIVSCDEIARFGGNNLTEVLERTTNLYFTGSTSFAQNSISLRGDNLNSFSKHILILFDGRPIREGQTGGTVSPFLLAFPVSMVEHIEILRGPSSVLYGSGAYTGVINIIPKRPTKAGVSGDLTIKGGSFNTKAAEGHLFWKKDDADLSLAAKYLGSDGWNFKGFDDNLVYSQGNYNQDNIAVMAAGHYKNFKFDSFWLDSKLNTLGGTWPIDPTEHQWLYTNLSYTQTWNTHWRSELNATLNQMNAQILIGGFPALADANSSLIEATHFFDNNKWHGLIGATANLMIGHSETKNYNGVILSQDMPQYQKYWYTLYTQLDYDLLKNLKLTVGGQAVKAGAIDWNFVPRGGITYHHELGWGIKALYGEAYRAAYINENGIDIPNVFKGNPKLKPETIKTVNVQLFYQNNNYQLAATYYHSLEQNLIISQAPSMNNPVWSNTNGKSMNFEGVELEAKAKLLDDRLLFTSSLSYQLNDFNGKKQTTTVPDWLANIGLSYNFDSGLSMGLYHNFSSRPHAVNNTFTVNPAAQPINLMTLKLSADLSQYPTIKLPVVFNFYSYNLLDNAINLPEFSDGVVNTLPQRSGQSFYFSMDYHFGS